METSCPNQKLSTHRISGASMISKPKVEEKSTWYSLNVRSFRNGDGEAVRAICRGHFRSLCVPAVKYYCLEHFRDLIALLVIGKIFQSWRDLFLAVILFVVYLFVRARVELEFYIYRDCPDLNDIANYYGVTDTNGRSHFWVAETIKRPQKGDQTGDPRHEQELLAHESKQSGQVVGCVGCSPTRDDPKVAQLVRLVVAEDARRMRNGSRLLAQFEHFAIEKGYREVRLYTNNLSTSHMKFIRQHGYEIVQFVSRSLMRGSLLQWKKVLGQPSATQPPKSGSETSLELFSEEATVRPRSNTLVVMD